MLTYTTPFPKLYGLSSTGKVKFWEIKLAFNDDEQTHHIVTEYGYVNGKTQTTSECIKQGKNIGKVNETSIYNQALAQAQSKWVKQHDHGYGTVIPNISHLPMLAQNYADKSHIIRWPWFGQPKFNGVRCVATIKDNQVRFTSRNGKEYHTLQHLKPELLEAFCTHQPIVLDGELFHPALNLQEIVKRVKREKSSRMGLEEVPVQYHIYDVMDCNLPFAERNLFLNRFINELSSSEYLYPVETPLLNNEKELISFNQYNLDRSYEGTMLRNPGGLYVPHYRSSDLLKYKIATFKDDDFTIVGGISAKGRDEGTVVFTCKTDDGQEFNVRPRGTVNQRRQWLMDIDHLIGKKLTVRYAELTPDGIPFHPTGLVIRDYE